MSGLARARAEGTRLGRPSLSREKALAIRQAKAAGKGVRRIARELGVGVGSDIAKKRETRGRTSMRQRLSPK